jgi:predicted dehydrogenase
MSTESRRSFLAGSASLATAASYNRIAGANDRPRIGLIGAGGRGTYLMREARKSLDAAFPAVCDVYDARRDKAAQIAGGDAKRYADYRQVLAERDIDAVIVATPDHWHAAITVDACKAGKDVYVEKPMTWSIEQGKEIMAAVKKTDRILQVGSQAKTSAITAKAREIVKSGALGKVSMVRMANHRNSPAGAWVYPIPPDASPQTIDWERFLGPSPKRPFDPKVFFRWRCWWEYSGGVATDLFVHMLTTLHEIMDTVGPKSAVSQGGLVRWNDGRAVPDVMDTIFEYPEGFVANLYVNLANSHALHGSAILGTEGTLLLGGGRGNQAAALTLYPEPPVPPAQVGEVQHLPDAMRREYFESLGYTADGHPKSPLPPPKAEQTFDVERGPSHYEYFIMSLRDRSPSREDAVAGHYAAGAAHLANLAYRRGKRMQWDLKTGKVSGA